MISVLFFFVLSAMVAAYIVLLPQLPPELPLHYTKPWGEERLGENWNILFIPMLMTIFFLVLSLIRSRWYPNDLVVQRICLAVNIAQILLCAVAYGRIMLKVAL